VTRRFASSALMIGNFVTGCAVLAPAGMLGELSDGLHVSIRTAGLLITFGAIVLCIGSPLTSWLTSRIERKALLGATLAVLALGNLASALVSNFGLLMAIRVIMLAVGALYTPQAAGTAALIVPAERRGSTIAYVFLGWSLAAAGGLPLITFIASHFGWHLAFAAIGVCGGLSLALLWWCVPNGLIAAPVDLRTWTDLAGNRTIVILLAITTLQMSGQFAVFTFMGPLLKTLTNASSNAVGLVFALYGIFGFIGLVIATRIVDSWGAYRTWILFTFLMLAGIAGWALSSGIYFLMAVSVATWGLGFASTNSMQQVRLVAAAPPAAPASIALNTSFVYVGQAIGSAIGGQLFARGLLQDVGFVGAGLVALTLFLVLLSRPGRAAVVPA
jgi:predicted MFS family arabinose efflux permease